jgi:hypothetical protein
MTVADVKGAAGSWSTDELQAALEHEQAHAGRKGAVGALEAALKEKES